MTCRLMLCAIALMVVGGCANNNVWVKPGASQQDFITDRYSCNKDAHQSNFGSGLAGAIDESNFFGQCMNAHGWYLEKQA